MNFNLLKIVVCPVCHKKLFFKKKRQELVCKEDQLIYLIRNGIPILMKTKAFHIS